MTTALKTLGAALVVTAALAAACSSAPNKPNKPADTTSATTPRVVTVTAEQRQRIHLVTVQPTTFRPVVEAAANVAFNGDRSTQVLSTVSGPAIRVIGTPGMNVTRGEPLAYVSSPDFATAVATYRKAETTYRNAKRIADRDSALFKNDALARADLEQAQTDAASAAADVSAALQAMRSLGVEDSQIEAVREGRAVAVEAIIRSPINGTVVEKLISDGQLLQAGTTPCFTVADLSTMWVMANVFANEIGDVSLGAPVDILTDVTRTPLPGKVDYIASLVDPGTKAVTVRILAPNQSRILRRDMFVRVQIKSDREHRGILVPTSSIQRDYENLPYVFVASGNGFLRRRVTLGTRVGDNYEVTGVNPGEQVVAEGSLFLQFAESQ